MGPLKCSECVATSDTPDDVAIAPALAATTTTSYFAGFMPPFAFANTLAGPVASSSSVPG